MKSVSNSIDSSDEQGRGLDLTPPPLNGPQPKLPEDADRCRAGMRGSNESFLIGTPWAAAQGGFTKENEYILACRLSDILQDYDAAVVETVMAERPDLFMRMSGVVGSQSGGELDRQKLELELQKKQQQHKAAGASGSNENKSLTPETLAQIEEAAGIL